MFEVIKGLFGAKKSSGTTTARRSRGRVNLKRRFRILSEVTAQGSMSKVFKAFDQETNRTVCLKVQDPEKTAAAMARTSGGASRRPGEGEIGLKIIHPNVARTFDYGQTTRNEAFVVMEFIEGPSLQEFRQTRALDIAARAELLAQTAEAIAAVHAAGFIHHDLTPRNLLVDAHDRIKLIDFGLAIPNTPEFRKPGNRTGTVQYLAPEVIRREPKDERLDIFSWGVIAFELLTGRLPYDTTGEAMADLRLRINSEALDPSDVAAHLPGDLCMIVRKALARKKEDRWLHAALVATAVRGLPLLRGDGRASRASSRPA
jgi:serine/threonine protein kinase